jgi:ribosomal protein S18 acetylase RimI-like enzyme
MQVDLVTRSGCHLCDEALAQLRALGLEPRLRDVDRDAELFTQFDFRVPVVLVDGRVVGEGRVARTDLARGLGLPDVTLARCGPEAAETVHRLTQAAFAGYTWLDPPSGVTGEGIETVTADLARHGGALAFADGRPLGCLRLEVGHDALHVRRVAVDPAGQGGGIGRALMRWADAEARRRGFRRVTVGVRLALTGNLEFYRRLGYRQTAVHSHPGYDRPTWALLAKDLDVC